MLYIWTTHQPLQTCCIASASVCCGYHASFKLPLLFYFSLYILKTQWPFVSNRLSLTLSELNCNELNMLIYLHQNLQKKRCILCKIKKKCKTKLYEKRLKTNELSVLKKTKQNKTRDSPKKNICYAHKLAISTVALDLQWKNSDMDLYAEKKKTMVKWIYSVKNRTEMIYTREVTRWCLTIANILFHIVKYFFYISN